MLRLAGIDWQVIAAPGHDRHAVMFYAPAERLLISGDALWEDGFGVVFEALQGRLEAFDEARATLEQIAALDVRTVIPGHGRPFEGVEHALERAHKRLAGYVADPMRLARHLAKVMLTFALLERRSLELDKLPEYVSRVPILRDVNTHWLKMTPPDFARYLVEDLERVGAIERTEGVIRPRVAA